MREGDILKFLVMGMPFLKLNVVYFTDTLGQLARCMGVENFSVYAPDCVALGLGLMERKDDPDVRKTCYLLFASLASVMKGDMAPHLPKVMKNMMMSLRSTDGVVVSIFHFFYVDFVVIL